MRNNPYKSPLVQVIWRELYPQLERAVAEVGSMPGMLWKALRPEIPNWLKALDDDKEAQKKVMEMVRGIVALVEELEDDNARCDR